VTALRAWEYFVNIVNGNNAVIPGNVVWALLAVIVASFVYPPMKAWIERILTRESSEIHRKLDHIILHHPDIPPLPPKPED